MEKHINWEKINGLLPVIVQDATSGTILMLGYMNPAALAKTQAEGRVTFYSRSKQRLWTKGEPSGHYLGGKRLHGGAGCRTLPGAKSLRTVIKSAADTFVSFQLTVR